MQFIEGLDNEVSFVLLFFTLLLVVIIPMYVMKPRRRPQTNRGGEQQRREQGEEETEPLNTENPPADTPAYSNNINSNTTVDSTVRTSCGDNIPVSNPSENENTSSQTNSSGVNEPSDTTNSAEMITIRVMHHETSQEVTVSKDMMLKDLKKKCFPTEYEAQRSIRLIYSGRILDGDTYPLRYLRIMNGSVLHAVVSTSSQTNETTGRSNESANVVTQDIDLSEYLLPLVSVMVFGSWSFVFAYSAMFSATTITMLGFLTILFVGFSFYGV